MKRYQGVDFCRVETLLTEEEVMVRDAVREWVSEQVMPTVAEHFERGEFPRAWIDGLASLGVIGAGLPDFGGGGLGPVARGLIYQELERGDSGLRSFASVTNSLVLYPIHAFGSPEQRERWLPGLVSGELLGCFGLTEPDFGSNPGGMLTRAEKTADGWRLNGAKRWITNGAVADVSVVFAKTDDGVRGFLVPKETPGFSAPEIRRKWSLRASVTADLIFEDCPLPEESLLPGFDGGLRTAFLCLNDARFGIAWGAVGAMQDCYDEGLEYALTRKQFRDRPIASHQLVQKRLSDILTEITKAQLLVLQIGRLKEQGQEIPPQISMAKRNNCHQALRIAREVRDLLGASGITHEYRVGRHLLNFESVNTYEGTHDIHHLILGEHLTGIPAYE